MEITVEREQKYFSEDGMVLCEADVALPCATAGEGEAKAAARITRFYTRVEAAALQLAERAVLPAARRALAAIPPERRRAVWRPLRLTVISTCLTAESEVTVWRTLSVAYRGRRLLSDEVCECILRSGEIIPLKIKKSEKEKKGKS